MPHAHGSSRALRVLTGADGDRYSQSMRGQSVHGHEAGSTRAGDLVALRRALHRAIGRVCPVWLADQREDIVQVAMTKVVRVIEGGKSTEQITTAYLSRVAYHAVVDEIRRQRRRRCMTALADSVEDTAVAEDPSPEAATAGVELGAEIRDCMSRMARSRRLAVGLYLEGSGATEIARMFEWKRKQADNLIYRGMGDLRRCLADKGLTP